MRILRRLRIDSIKPDVDMLTVRHIFRGHVQSSNSPALHIVPEDGGFILDLDVRTFDNYKVNRALDALKLEFPSLRDVPVPKQE